MNPIGDGGQGVEAGAAYHELRARSAEVVRLVCACPSFRAAVAVGLDADDLRQDVLVQVYSRRWDPRRGGLSTFVWLVTRSVAVNAVRNLTIRGSHAVALGQYAEHEAWRRRMEFAVTRDPEIADVIAGLVGPAQITELWDAVQHQMGVPTPRPFADLPMIEQSRFAALLRARGWVSPRTSRERKLGWRKP